MRMAGSFQLIPCKRRVHPRRSNWCRIGLVLRADDKDVCNVEFRIEDANGVRVPDGAQEVTFIQTGPARILGIGNGDVDSVEDCKTNTHQAYQGRGLAILSAGTTPGDVTLTATSPGLKSAATTLRIR